MTILSLANGLQLWYPQTHCKLIVTFYSYFSIEIPQPFFQNRLFQRQDTATVKSLSNGKDVEKGHNPSKKRIEPNQTHKEVHEKLDPTNDIPSPKLINDLPEKSIIESQTEVCGHQEYHT